VLQGSATALLLAFGFVACGDDAVSPYTTPDGGSPIYSTGGGGLYDAGAGVGGPAVSSLPPGQVYMLDSGVTPGQFGGTNGNGSTLGVNPAGGGVAGALTGGGGAAAGALGGGSTAGAIGGLLGGLGGGGAFAGIAGGGAAGAGTGGGSTGPSMPLDPSVKKPDASKLPQVKGTCPNIATGFITVNGTTAQLTVGSKAGPMVFYWHGTGTDASEVEQGLPGTAADIRANGGVLASFNDSNGKGDDTGDAVWYTGDIESADQLLACAIQKNLVDTGRIHTSGYSAGGLQSGAMLFSRSNYLASVLIYSGGPALGGLVPGSTTFNDPTNVPATLGAHGAQGSDWLILDFHDGTLAAEDAVKKAGGFAIDCDDNGSHLDFLTIRGGVGGQAWKFFKDHPYNSKPDPYMGGLPAGYPSYCKIH
jgi:hypothetical protein